MTAAVVALVDEFTGDRIGDARAQLAVALARLVDGGSVPAARELRAVLVDIEGIENDEIAAFLLSVQTPRSKAEQ